jgi:lactoylglutathione lyase
VIVGAPFDGQSASAGNGQMTAFTAPDRATVDRCHALSLEHGGHCEGPPGLRPQYHADYYGAYFRDPDGNKLCVVCHSPWRTTP